MARTSWFDEDARHPLIHEQIEKLESFTTALADGQVSKQELAGQEQHPGANGVRHRGRERRLGWSGRQAGHG